ISMADSLNSFVYVLRLIMIPSPWVYHALNLLSTIPGEVQTYGYDIDKKETGFYENSGQLYQISWGKVFKK
ncbi:MAG: hypothetical protein LBH20_11365, partial [Treponema sp.]|nr:hypothetical protein [Treponema sp.]